MKWKWSDGDIKVGEESRGDLQLGIEKNAEPQYEREERRATIWARRMAYVFFFFSWVIMYTSPQTKKKKRIKRRVIIYSYIHKNWFHFCDGNLVAKGYFSSFFSLVNKSSLPGIKTTYSLHLVQNPQNNPRNIIKRTKPVPWVEPMLKLWVSNSVASLNSHNNGLKTLFYLRHRYNLTWPFECKAAPVTIWS